VRGTQPIGEILADLAKSLGIAQKLSEQEAVVAWSDVVGEKIAQHSRAVRVDRGRLFVEVDSSVWVHELRFMKQKIMRELNNRVGKTAIENVHFVIGGASAYGASGVGSRED
jgi:predicted nucleic acid-binding Zn ribbon protein